MPKRKSAPEPALSVVQEKPKKQGNIYDTFVKNFFCRLFIMIDFLKNYADPKFVAQIELRKIAIAPTHYVSQKGDERILDLVFQCPLKNGQGNFMVVIIFEHQSGSLKHIARKLLKYISAIWEAEIKEGKKVLSIPYFIVLRTGKRPSRKRPGLEANLPTGLNDDVYSHVPTVPYDLVDLPAIDFDNLRGGPELRLVVGMLKKMTEGLEDEFPEALWPILEIDDSAKQIEFTKEMLEFVAKVMAAHNRKIDEKELKKVIRPILAKGEDTMIKTIFEEKYEEGKLEGKLEGIAEGEARGKAKGILRILANRFGNVPKRIQDKVDDISNLGKLDELTDLACVCVSLNEFKIGLDD